MTRVLVIEDERDSAWVIASLLEHYDIEVEVARNGRAGLDRLADFLPDVVITDLAMPEVDGWSVLKTIRSNPETASMPVIATTAFHSPSVQRDALEAGFTAYYPKPIDADMLVAEIETMVG
ncbi:MAG: response regulator [Chloroflexi bacterium]|nr:response regulator [Chloroflexota bacterium]